MNVNYIAPLREQLKLSQSELGERISVTRQTIAAWEKGERLPTRGQLTEIAQALRVPVDLFFKQEMDTPTLLFRADDASALSLPLRAFVTQKVEDYSELEGLLGEIPALPPAFPLDQYDEGQVERLAREVRDFLGVEEASLGDVLSLLEDRGFKIILTSLPKSVSGFSAYTEAWGAVIVVNQEHAVERQYFTAVHELAHLICHRKDYVGRTVLPTKDPREKIANHLAGATLLARDVVERELRAYRGRWIPDPILITLKHRYSVSMRTILMRAEQVGLITLKQRGQQIGVLNRDWGVEGEPTKLQRHFACVDKDGKSQTITQSRLERLVYQAASQDLIQHSRAAEILGQSASEFRKTLNKWLPHP